MRHEEDREQAELCKWLDAKGIVYFAIPNGGARDVVTGANLKRTGVKPGVPDLFIPVPAGTRYGMFIEMKRVDGGVVSKHQTKWIQQLRQNGYEVRVCHGAIEAEHAVEEYMRYYGGL